MRAADAKLLIATTSASLAVATAAWLLPAFVRIVQWTENGPTRLALLRPSWQLLAGGAAALVVSLLIWGAVRDGRDGGSHRANEWTRRMLVMSWLWLWVVPFVPWLPDRLPLLLVLEGPVRWLIPAAILLALIPSATWQGVTALWPSMAERLTPARVWGVSLVVYAALGVYAARSVGVGGDEPHYLVIAESLLKDGDLRIENNHRQRDYASFFQGELRPDFFERGKDGEIYSIHAPGLPALALPAYALGGRLGVVLFISLLAALTALAVFQLGAELGGPSVGALAWAACCFSVPFVPYAWLIFPEMPGACLMAWAALWLHRKPSDAWTTWMWRGLALGAWPWLHTKFIVFLVVFSLGFAWRLRRSAGTLAALGLPIGLSVAAWLYSFYDIYGSFNPEAPYGVYTSVYVLTKYIPHGLLGILFDQKFGLLPYAPAYLFAPFGLWTLWRRPEHRALIVVLFFTVTMFMVSTARLYMFWGGASAPARFLVPLLPCLAPMVANGIASARAPLWKAVAMSSLAIGLAMSIAGAGWPARFVLFSVDHGKSRVLELIQAGSPLANVVPTFTDPDWLSHLPALALWLGAGVVALVAARLVARRSTGSGAGSGFAPIGVLAGVWLLGAAILTGRPSAAVRDEVSRRGAIETMWRFDGDRYRTLDYQTLGRTTPERLVELLTIDATIRSAAGRDRRVLTDPIAIPAGTYEAVVVDDAIARAASGAGRDGLGQIQFTVADQPTPVLAVAAGQGGLTRIPFVLPFASRRLAVTVSADALSDAPSDALPAVASDVSGHPARRVRIVPRALQRPSLREPVPVRLTEAIPDHPGAFVGYTDEHAYPESGTFWSRGFARTQVLLVAPGARSVTLHLTTGPVGGAVDVEVDGEHQHLDVAPNTSVPATFAISASRPSAIRVSSSSMFRPSDVDPSSSDGRGLGCQVRISLQ